MKNALIFLLLLTFSCSHKQSNQLRGPGSIISRNYTCSKIMRFFFGNPYKKNYKLQNFSYDEAVKAFNKNLDRRAKDLKMGSQPFMRLQTSKKKAPTVVLLHGWSDGPASMRELAEMYYAKGFNVVAPLLRDHGLKGTLQESALKNSSLADWRADIDFALSVAKGLSDGKKVHIGGYSMGASLAMDLSWRHPDLIASRTLYAPLFRENGFVPQAAVWLLEVITKGSFFKEIEETSAFYKRMTYRQVAEMHRLLRQIQPHLLQKNDDIPTAIFRVDRNTETTVDDKFIDKFSKVYNLEEEHHIYDNGKSQNPVLHRDFTSSNINSNDQPNPALNFIYDRLNSFLDTVSD